jgi:hypothetical protein
MACGKADRFEVETGFEPVYTDLQSRPAHPNWSHSIPFKPETWLSGDASSGSVAPHSGPSRSNALATTLSERK